VRIKLEAGFVTENEGKVLIRATGVRFKDLHSFLSLVNDYAVPAENEETEKPMGFKGLTNARSTVAVTPDSGGDED